MVPALVTVPLPQLHARAEFHPWRPDRADAPPHPQRPRHPDGTGGHHHPVHPRQVSEVLDPGRSGVVDRGGVRA
ncbi:hypothetical protein [Kocuria varians]|uniref:hypothetical protein n=1 Tax=Kocuria varians TaxID=1272 RepID=UPI0011420C60|nr:hypothetical protein [Kocuria varians]